MKKIIAALISLITILAVLPAGAENTEAEAAEQAVSEELETMSGLGIIDYSEPDEYMTRGEFALVIYNMMKTDTVTEETLTWEESFFGEFVNDTSNVVVKEEERKSIPMFIDVPLESDYYDEITLLELPYKEHVGEDRLQIVYDTNTLSNRPKSSRSGTTYAVIASTLWLDGKSVLWKVPTDEADIKDTSKYNMATITIFPSDASAYGHVTGYGINEKSMYARWNIYKDVTNYTIEGDDNSFFVVTDVRDEILASGELATIIDGYSCAHNSNMVQRTLYCTEEGGRNLKGEPCNPAKNATSFYEIYNEENISFYSVQKGDIIKYSYQSENIYPDTIAILYRAKTGEILESTGSYSSNYKAEKTNPFVLTYQYQKPNATDPALHTGSRNFILGYAHNVIDNLLTISTQDLKNNGYDITKGNGTLIEKRTYIASGLRGIIIEYGSKNIKVTQTTSLDTEIKTYEDYGFKCDKILAVNAGSIPHGTFIIREAE